MGDNLEQYRVTIGCHMFGRVKMTKVLYLKDNFSLTLTQALVYLLHLIRAGLESDHCSARLFFADFRKGFDLVYHNIVGEHKNLDIHLVTIRWI